jgi:hypothetical protein
LDKSKQRVYEEGTIRFIRLLFIWAKYQKDKNWFYFLKTT